MDGQEAGWGRTVPGYQAGCQGEQDGALAPSLDAFEQQAAAAGRPEEQQDRAFMDQYWPNRKVQQVHLSGVQEWEDAGLDRLVGAPEAPAFVRVARGSGGDDDHGHGDEEAPLKVLQPACWTSGWAEA
jgi:hypothetical protein